MQKRKLDNQTLDALGKKLVKSDAARPGDIEKIISNPQLFAMVKRRIEANNKAASFAAVPVWKGAALFAAVALIVGSAIGLERLLRSEKTEFVAMEVQVPEANPDVTRPAFPPKPVFSKFSAGRAFTNDFRVEKAVLTKKIVKKERKPDKKLPKILDAEFYAVSYAGDPSETGGRIIRVDMSRSSLFALGVNLSLENDDQVVKADLLVGSDGVTRAIRVVK